MRRLSVILVLAAAAQAQPKPDDLSITIDPELESVGRGTCLEEMGVERTIRVTLSNSGDFDLFELRLSFTRDTTDICSIDVVDACPATEGQCRCLEATENNGSVAWQGTLAEAADVDAATLCSFLDPEDEEADAEDRAQERRLYFYPHYATINPELEDDEDPIRGDEIRVTIDFNPPEAPRSAPKVESSERALRVTIGAVSDGAADVDHYEVCVKEAVLAAGLDAGAVDADGYLKCVDADADEEVKVKNLHNDVTYEVIYRAVDGAGNKGDPSPPAEGVPAEQLDFAEVYRARGGLETGGCASTGLGGAGLLGLLVLLGARLRRQR